MSIHAASFYSRFGKRILDFVLLLVALPPVLFLLALLVPALAVYWRGNPFFIQQRVGLSERKFWLIKLKTMREVFGASGVLLDDAVRITPTGRLLRRWSLDEMPEVWHIVTGKMSWVGPRPLLPEYLPLYNERQRQRHTVKPGLAGWAQIQGRNAIDWQARLEHDAWYADNASFRLDLKILLQTIALVISGKGVHAAGHDTMPRFIGADG